MMLYTGRVAGPPPEGQGRHRQAGAHAPA
jgi:hypothetical protein